jgi:CheY-like chemotaxis protein
MRLPCTQTGELAAETRTLAAGESARPGTSVLVVDEDGSERRLIACLLETAGFRVTQAANAKEALILIAHDRPDVVLTDILMREKDGLELIQEVRRLEQAPPIIAMAGTGRADTYLNVARFLGAEAVLKKPIEVDQLLRFLREAC